MVAMLLSSAILAAAFTAASIAHTSHVSLHASKRDGAADEAAAADRRAANAKRYAQQVSVGMLCMVSVKHIKRTLKKRSSYYSSFNSVL
jgi:hypothetical protein